MVNETELIRALILREGDSFTILYQRYSEQVYNTALSYTKSIQDAEEVTQDVFVKVFKSIVKFNGDSSLSTWLYRITVNTSLTHLKKKNKFSLFKASMPESKSVEFNHPGVLMENKENAASLYRVLDCLPDSQKTAFILSYIEDLPRQKVADIMESTLKSVESLLQRAKQNMRKELEKEYPNRRNSKKNKSK